MFVHNKKFNLSAYTVMHFIVDLSCIFFLMGMDYVRLPSYDKWILAAVIYNMFAFALPMFLGFAADILGKNALTSCIGCSLILLNYIVIPDPWLSIAMIGIGNGLFHLGGGRQVIQDAKGRFASTGIFVASGAIGVYLGRNMAKYYRAVFYTGMWILLALSVLVLLFMTIRQRKETVRSIISKQKITSELIVMSLMIFIVVIIRSYYGGIAVYSWNNTFLMGLIFTLCVFAGKFTGGILADKIGVMKASLISLAGAGILVLFAEKSPAAGCLSILLFNMTMPITLSLLAEQWKEFPGFAFGTLMMALFLGTLPSMVWKIYWLASPLGLCLLCFISVILLIGAVKIRKRSENE